jgi:tRNA(Ile)-lysidine synthase
LLFATRAELEQYASEHRILWREDVSNATTDYERNFIRHRVLPLLKEINPSLEQTVMQGWEKQAVVQELYQKAFQQWSQEFIQQEAGKIRISKKAFDHLEHKASMLWNLIHHLGFHFDVCQRIVEAWRGQPGKVFQGTAHELIIDRDVLILHAVVPLWEPVPIHKDQSSAHIGSWNITLERISLEHANKLLGEQVRPDVALLDAEMLSFPLQWRQWQDGDSFLPLGMRNRKKVSDLLIDEKVNRADKSRVTVLLSGGEIVWVVGHRIDDRFKLTGKTRHVVRLTVSPYFA